MTGTTAAVAGTSASASSRPGAVVSVPAGDPPQLLADQSASRPRPGGSARRWRLLGLLIVIVVVAAAVLAIAVFHA